jgi:superfamily II DNA or RNA helicase
MYKHLRKKIASSLSGLEHTDDFAYSKWLKEPQFQEFQVDSIYSALIDTAPLNTWLEKPEYQSYKVPLNEADVLPELKKVLSRKTKTSAVFFGFGSVDTTKVKLADYSTLFKKQKSGTKEKPPEPEKVKWSAPPPKVASPFKNLKPEVLKYDLIKTEVFTADKYAGKGSKVDFELITSIPKIYKVKIPGIDKIKLGKIYFLKNIKPENPKVQKGSFNPVDNPEIFELNLDLLGVVWTEEQVPPVSGIEEPETFESTTPETFESITPETFESTTPETFETAIPKKFEPVDEIDDFLDNIIGKFSAIEDISIDETPDLMIEVTDDDKDLNEAAEETEDEIVIPDEPEEIPVSEEEEEEEKVVEPSDEVEGFEISFDSLYSYQETGAEFLINQKFALLADDMGLGKTVQAVSALKNLFTSGKIKTALIICSKSEVGTAGKFNGVIDGWLGHLNSRTPELKTNYIDGSPHERSSKWNAEAQVYIAAYDSFFFDLEENLVDKKKLKGFGCIIIDEAQHLFKRILNSDKLNKSIQPAYLWALSGYPADKIKNEINSVLNQKFSIKGSLKRTKTDVAREIPGIIWQENWLDLDELQQTEYADSLKAAKEKVNWLIESGNPLRFQANIFTILHQLKQVCNFSEKSDTSPKTDLLLEHIDNIVKNKRKVIIFSQYDKLGTKKIEAFLKKHSVKYITYAPGMSTKDMELAVKNFSENNATNAMIAGVKPSRIKIISGEVPYIIHFDQWWNPASLWQTEELVASLAKEKKQNENVNVYSYLSKGTIEEMINKLLYRKGFLNKNVMDLFSAEAIGEMIANEEWLEVFDMPDRKFNKSMEKKLHTVEDKLMALSDDNFTETVKMFLTKLGFKNMNDIQKNDGKITEITGSAKKAKAETRLTARIIPDKSIDYAEVKSHLSELKENANRSRAFIITRGHFKDGNPVYHPAISLIDKKVLVNYFSQFQII